MISLKKKLAFRDSPNYLLNQSTKPNQALGRSVEILTAAGTQWYPTRPVVLFSQKQK